MARALVSRALVHGQISVLAPFPFGLTVRAFGRQCGGQLGARLCSARASVSECPEQPGDFSRPLPLCAQLG